ncbi:MAG TPA: aminoglycoside phosphotransferase family protein [Caulobacteraceae bacterium]|jgi:thiamine kinase-like enzyme|nr:aminoglycoside phosphotransferase family protein [Caulobacteraceae bacterium]
MADQPSAQLRSRAATRLGWTPEAWRAVAGGYTPAARYRVSAGGRKAFVKAATTPLTGDMLRREAFAYQRVRAAFMPKLLGWEDHPTEPVLIIEDLSGATWPPPWDARCLDAALAGIDAMHRTPADLHPMAEAHTSAKRGWATVAENPAPFLALGMASSDWLTRSLPRLIEAEAQCRLDGPALCHFDLRSDNMCIAGSGVKFIDWAEACLGDARLDLGFWLPSLAFEGGPKPQEILPDAPDVAAWVSGFFAALAGLPDIPGAPFVRRVQREQLSTALPWAVDALGLGEL